MRRASTEGLVTVQCGEDARAVLARYTDNELEWMLRHGKIRCVETPAGTDVSGPHLLYRCLQMWLSAVVKSRVQIAHMRHLWVQYRDARKRERHVRHCKRLWTQYKQLRARRARMMSFCLAALRAAAQNAKRNTSTSLLDRFATFYDRGRRTRAAWRKWLKARS
jgi:hypothetical protein